MTLRLTMTERLLALTAPVALATACASFQGMESAARLQSPDSYAAAASLPAQGGEWPRQTWVADIGGAPLQALVDEALAGNPGLRVAASRLTAARSLSDTAAAAGRPSVDASFSSTYQRYSENGQAAPSLAGRRKSDNELALNFSYEFDFWGKHSAALRAAVSHAKAAEAELHAARLLLTAAIARLWVNLARQHEHLDLVERQMQIREKMERLTQQRLAAGLDTQTDHQQSRRQSAALRVEQAHWQEAIALTRNQLAALLGQGPDRGQRIPRAALPALGAAALPDQLPLGLLGRRPDVVAARWRAVAAQGGIDHAKAQFYPNINLMAFVGLSSLGLSNLFERGSRIDGIGPAISLPVFDGGRLRAQLQGRIADYDGAVAGYHQALSEALREVADQVQSLRAAETQIRNQEAATEAAQALLDLERQRQRAGTVNMLRVLAAEASWLDQCKLGLDARARSVDLRVGLFKSLGGGFEAARYDLAAPSAGPSVTPPSATQTPPTTHSTLAKSAS
ncbi:MAG TPA: efflux transporter outer membrane subunit [Paucimonas sp.]|nr:efflux transporter outer membrane subunit [Paucimonas sp.]